MIQLSEKFKQAISSKTFTSLYPVVRFYKGVRADEKDTWADAESFNISIKSTYLDNIYFDPILLNEPNIKSKADIVNNKYTISTVNIDISNTQYNGKFFSDDIKTLLNSVCQIYYTANGINSIEDSLLVYTGIVRRYRQYDNRVTLTIEDVTEQVLKLKIPSTLISSNNDFSENDIGKPFPMVYGFVDRSPLIKQYTGLNNQGQLENRLAELHVDKPNSYIRGLWDDNKIDYNLPSEHRLYLTGILPSSDAHIFVFNQDNFTPIHRQIPNDWGFGQFSVSSEENNRIVYDFNLQYTEDSASTFKLNTGAVLGGSDIGIPSRIYRPIEKCEFFIFNDNNNDGHGHSINKIYGFTEFTSGEVAYQKYYKDFNIYDDEYYNHNWFNSQTWWQPTSCNENYNGGVFSQVDSRWATNGRDPVFPVERLQDGTLGTGLWFTGKNEDGARSDGSKSGGCFVKLILKNNVGSHPCGTAVYYDAECHSFSYMNQPNKMPYHAQFWTNRELVEQLDEVSDLIDGDNCETVGEIKDIGNPVTDTGPYVPNSEFEDVIYADQQDDEDSVRKINGKAISESFIKTDEFDSIQFGIPQYNKLGNDPGGHTGYNSTQLFNAWVIQDALIDNPLNQNYYGSVVGRGELINNPNVTNVYVCKKIDVEPLGDGVYDEFTYNLRIGINEEESAIFAQEIDQFILNSEQQLFLEIITNGIWKNSYFDFSRPSLNEDGFYYIKIDNLPAGSFAIENEYQVDIDFFLRDEEPILECITSSDGIMKDILRSELNYQGEVDSSAILDNWQFSFTLLEQTETKQFFENFFKSTLQIPSFNEKSEFKFINIKQIIDNYANVKFIQNEDVISYSYDLTKLDDIYTSVNVKYKKNYATDEYEKETSYSLIDGNQILYDNYQTLSEFMYPNSPNLQYNINYYGMKHEECKLEFESDFIRDDDTARKLQKKLVSWYANQHLKIKLDLSISYINLEVGDYVKFTHLLDNKLAFGYDYTIQQKRNGQLIYDVFFITSIQKNLNKTSLELVQVHRGEYGYPNNISEDPNIPLSDDGSIDGQGNHTLPDPNDNPNYDNENITDEFEQEVITDDIFNCYMLNNVTNLTFNVLNSIVNTNISEEWDYKIFVTNVTSSQGFIEFPEDAGLNNNRLVDGIYNEENNPPGMNLVYHHKTISNMFDNFNGMVEISKKYNIILENQNDYASIDFIIKLFNTEKSEYLLFSQTGEFNQNYNPGDVNGDGITNILDVVMLVNAVVGSAQLDFSSESAADINQDGILNVLDVVQLVNLILE